jgi:hypothetical protein
VARVGGWCVGRAAGCRLREMRETERRRDRSLRRALGIEKGNFRLLDGRHRDGGHRGAVPVLAAVASPRGGDSEDRRLPQLRLGAGLPPARCSRGVAPGDLLFCPPGYHPAYGRQQSTCQQQRQARAVEDATRVPCSEKKTAEIERRPLIEVVRGPMAAADVVRPPRSVRRCGYNRTEGGRVREVLQEASVV